eukprot:CAMPEP_0179967446 /NCGR_PEP_ID=MMETSP0983-20121128/33176_1 /TAXON_ID=483367 /ORGANISM="non described non described, Strain CCMP 2436" /LENGTH=32 /DNA_ID= /DNA_START= /DNA_END= /DNA_ORIENTATION=
MTLHEAAKLNVNVNTSKSKKEEKKEEMVGGGR